VEAFAISPIKGQLSASVRVRPQAQGALMQLFVVLVPLAILAACSPGTDVTGSTSQCVASNYKSYDEKNFDQCVAACIKCERGVTTTCTTACRLRGAK
jgi:hypothetical protein